MLLIQCPRCFFRMAVEDAQSGGVGACGQCQQRFRIPTVPVPAENAPVQVAPDPHLAAPPPTAYAPPPAYAQPPAYTPPPAYAPPDDVDEVLPGDPEYGKPRRRRRRRRGPGIGSIFGAFDPFVWALIIMGALWLVSTVVIVIFPPLAVFPLLVGGALSVVGAFWFLGVAFQESVLYGMLCLFIPFFSLYFLITNFDVCARPFFIYLIGAAFLISALAVMPMKLA